MSGPAASFGMRRIESSAMSFEVLRCCLRCYEAKRQGFRVLFTPKHARFSANACLWRCLFCRLRCSTSPASRMGCGFARVRLLTTIGSRTSRARHCPVGRQSNLPERGAPRTSNNIKDVFQYFGACRPRGSRDARPVEIQGVSRQQTDTSSVQKAMPGPPRSEPFNAHHVLQYHRSRTAALVCGQGASANQRRPTLVRRPGVAIKQPDSRKVPLLRTLEQAEGPA